jgi:hypothetical protein
VRVHGVFQPPGCAAHDVEALYRRGAAVAIPCLFGKDFLSPCFKPGNSVQKKAKSLGLSFVGCALPSIRYRIDNWGQRR